MKKVISCLLSIVLLFSYGAITTYASESEVITVNETINITEFFQKIIDFINNILKKLFSIFGIENTNEPIVSIEGNRADVSVNFGAYGDGINDDTLAIQNALDYMKESGGTIYFPDGTYMISSCLIFYSNQELVFSDNATLKRMESSEPTKYMLATYTSSNIGSGEYNGVHNSKIVGGTFDGNENIASNLTVINLCHANNITISDASFINGSNWHYVEIASSKKVYINNCNFDAESYVSKPAGCTDELIQLDVAKSGNYGPIYNVDGQLVNFVKDEVPCVEIEIKNCIFNCAGSPAIGEHNGYAHSNISICDNTFNGYSYRKTSSRGYMIFMSGAHSVEIYNNVFNSTAENGTVNRGIIFNNDNTDTNMVYNNVFNGYFSEYCSKNAITQDNKFTY